MKTPSTRPTRLDRDDESEARDIVMRLPGNAGERFNELAGRVVVEGWEAVLGGVPIAEQVRRLAALHGVTYGPTVLDALAADLTRLSGDEITLDDTELLLIALTRAGHVTRSRSLELQHAHLQQRAAL